MTGLYLYLRLSDAKSLRVAKKPSYCLLRQRLGNRNGNGDGHADHRVVALGNLRKIRDIFHILSYQPVSLSQLQAT